jgi:hypothetical protein
VGSVGSDGSIHVVQQYIQQYERRISSIHSSTNPFLSNFARSVRECLPSSRWHAYPMVLIGPVPGDDKIQRTYDEISDSMDI